MSPRTLPLLVPALLTASACSNAEDFLPAPAPGQLVQSALPRSTTSSSSTALARTTDALTAFGLDVVRELTPANDNIAFSPLSLWTALSMTYAGAAGDTQAAFERVLRLVETGQAHHLGLNTLDRALASRGQEQLAGQLRPFRLRSNNQLFLGEGETVLEPFLDTLAVHYGAGVRLLDFAHSAEASRVAINGWIENNTEGLIPELLKVGTIDASTAMVLVNTLYFNASWKRPFKRERTGPGTFHSPSGDVTVSMMAGEDLAAVRGAIGDVDVIDMPYAGDELSMLILVPAAGQLAELEDELDAPLLSAFAAAATRPQGALRMPKFEARTAASMREVLTRLGLGVAFSDGADLSGINGKRDLRITDVVHEAVVLTDEAGTEAAAASAVVVGRVSAPEFFVVDRPFLYFVRDRGTGAVLFMGRITNPEAHSAG